MHLRSHITPRAYLQRFASTAKRGTGKLWVYERGKTPRLGTPKSEGAERGYLACKMPDGSVDDDVPEAWAQKIEDNALDALIHSPNPCFVWNRRARERMAAYWALMFVRARAAFEFHRSFWGSSLTATQKRIQEDSDYRKRLVQRYSFLSGRSLSEEEIVASVCRVTMSMNTEVEMRSDFVKHLPRRTEMYSKFLLSKPWQIWLAPRDSEFVSCDSPVMTIRFDNFGRYYVGDGFGREGTVALLPLSPRACLFAGLQGSPTQVISEHDVWEMNRVLVGCSIRFTYSKTKDDEIDALVQESAGFIRYGVDAFRANTADDVLEAIL